MKLKSKRWKDCDPSGGLNKGLVCLFFVESAWDRNLFETVSSSPPTLAVAYLCLIVPFLKRIPSCMRGPQQRNHRDGHSMIRRKYFKIVIIMNKRKKTFKVSESVQSIEMKEKTGHGRARERDVEKS